MSALHLFHPNEREMTAAGFGAVANVPCILNDQWEYQVDASLYLRHRALLEATFTDSSLVHFKAPRYPTPISLKAFGYALVNFLEWCSAHKPILRWQEVEYTKNIIYGYQADMLSGTWSVRRMRLSASTVNARVGEACRFLSWAASRGLRGSFKVISSSRAIRADSGTSAVGHSLKVLVQRAGSVRPDPKEMEMPSDSEVSAWHQAVRIEKGYTKALMCELIFDTSVRREECAQWRVDTLPLDKGRWRVRGDEVVVTVKYGAKGQKKRDKAGELVGPSRFVSIPLELAERIAEYREFHRPRFLASYARAAKTNERRRARMNEPSKRLFISEFTGRPVSAGSIYEAWTGCSRMPFPGWSPQLGRHYWACKTLLKAARQRIRNQLPGRELESSFEDVKRTLGDVILLVIKPQLGHISVETTRIYIDWAIGMLRMSDLSDAYSESLEAMAVTSIDQYA